MDLANAVKDFLLSGLIVFLVAALISPRFTWALRKPFLASNRLQWLLTFPLRRLLQDARSNWPRRIYLAAFPLILVYSLLIYILLLPVRVVNAVYFDLALFWSVSLRDGLADLLLPGYRYQDTRERIHKWITRFPSRLWRFFARYARVIFQGVAMTVFDLVWPTLTLFHGTGRSAAEKIARTGRWHAGGGDYAGTGIYFGLVPQIAEHYARHNSDPIVIVARVNLTPCRPIATLPSELRRMIGGSRGDAISRGLGSPWVSLEHWREDGQWYEFCLVQRSKFRLVAPWRIRPICIAGPAYPERVPGGLVPWPKTRRSWRVAGATALLFLAFTSAGIAGWKSLPEGLDTGALFSRMTTADPAASVFSIGLARGDQGTPADPDTCASAKDSRLQVGSDACVSDLAGSSLRLRTEPGIREDTVIDVLQSGQRLNILEGPVCAHGYTWWKLRTSEGQTGWAAEGDDRDYYLENCP